MGLMGIMGLMGVKSLCPPLIFNLYFLKSLGRKALRPLRQVSHSWCVPSDTS